MKRTRNYRKKKPAGKIAKVCKFVNRLQRSRELKAIDYSINVTPDYDGQVIALCGLGQGDTSASRDGISVSASSLDINLRMVLASTNYDMCRVVIFRHRAPDGVDPIPTDYLLNASVTNAPQSQRNHQHRHNLVKYHDKIYTTNTGGNNVTLIKKTIPLKALKIGYTGTGSTSASVFTNGLYMLLITSRSNATTNPVVGGYIRLRFYDD